MYQQSNFKRRRLGMNQQEQDVEVDMIMDPPPVQRVVSSPPTNKPAFQQIASANSSPASSPCSNHGMQRPQSPNQFYSERPTSANLATFYNSVSQRSRASDIFGRSKDDNFFSVEF